MSKTRYGATGPDHPAEDADDCRLLRAMRETPEVFEAIKAGPQEELSLQKQLRDAYADELVRAALSLHELRQRAEAKFQRADRMWFDRVGLEQATSEAVARHKAGRFAGRVDDLCCGIGGDTLALADHCTVRSVDRRESLALMTVWNSEVYGVADSVQTVVGDAASFLKGAHLVHIDPDRRSGSRRSVRIEDYQPGLDQMCRLIDSRPGGAIKLSPASNFGGKFPDCEIELVSVRGECKEAIVWFGSLAGELPWRASVLPDGASISGEPLSVDGEVRSLCGVIYDPDPAVVRSGLLDVVAAELGLDRIDLHEEYLSSETEIDSPFVTPFRILADLPNSEKQVRRYFRDHSFGSVEIKCRRIPVDVESMRRKLTLAGKEPITLIFARVNGRSRALVCRRVPSPLL